MSSAIKNNFPKSKVVIHFGPERYQNTFQSLAPLKKEIKTQLTLAPKIVIKPNLVTLRPERKAAITHPDAIRAILDFIIPLCKKNAQILIAEECATGSTQEAFRNFGYNALAREYPLTLYFLENDPVIPVRVYSKELKRDLVQHVYKIFLDDSFIISVGPAKTHDSVIVTLSLKNIVISALQEKYKTGRANFHQGPKALNLTIATLAQRIHPDLSVIDAFEVMEGNGPTAGSLVPMHLAVASRDFLAADSMMTRLMGFDPKEIGYLHYCHQKGLGKMELVDLEIESNVDWRKHIHYCKPHLTYFFQKRWKIPKSKSRKLPS